MIIYVFNDIYRDVSGKFELWNKKSWKMFWWKKCAFFFVWNDCCQAFQMQIVTEKKWAKKCIGIKKGVFLKLDVFIQGKFKQIEKHSMHFLPIYMSFLKKFLSHMSFLKKQNKFLKFISISNNCKKISKFFSVHKFFLDLRFRKIVRRFIGNSPRATGNIKKISLGLRPREIFLIFPLP